MASRPYDIVVFGSTGYTGKFVNEELYRLQNGGRQELKWAAAGRSKEKLQKSLRGTVVNSQILNYRYWLEVDTVTVSKEQFGIIDMYIV